MWKKKRGKLILIPTLHTHIYQWHYSQVEDTNRVRISEKEILED